MTQIETPPSGTASSAPSPAPARKRARVLNGVAAVDALKAQAADREVRGGRARTISRQTSRVQLQSDFIHALAVDFAANGPGIIRVVRLEEPATYLKIIASVLPKEFIVSENVLGDMPDEEIAEALAAIRKLRAAHAVPVNTEPDRAPLIEHIP